VFTGYLIRRFGWDSYRRFYRKVSHGNFQLIFCKHYGMSFEEAWQRCRDESTAMASLMSRLRNDRLFNVLE